MCAVPCRVHCARPVRNTLGSGSDYTVAMDPEDKKRVQQDMQGRMGLECAIPLISVSRVPLPYE